MRGFGWTVMGLLLFSAVAATADDGKPDFSGAWKLDAAHSQMSETRDGMTLLIEEKDDNIHIKETRGPDPKDDVSEFTCGTMGKECPMQDGGAKAAVSVYYNGTLLVILKTHGRKSSAVAKQRLSLSPSGDALTMEIMHIEPDGKAEKLVFSKSQ